MPAIQQHRDLSEYQGMISTFFKQPASREEWDRHRLGDEQVAFFNENGYLADVKMPEEWQVDALNE